MTDQMFHIEIVQGVVHRATLVPADEVTAGVVTAISQLKQIHNGFTILVSAVPMGMAIDSVGEMHAYPSKSGTLAVSERIADQPHEYESPRGVAGPILECAVCGQLRSAPVHG